MIIERVSISRVFLIRFLHQITSIWSNQKCLVNSTNEEKTSETCVHDMTEYFIKLKSVMKEKRIIELNVWNMNETNFCIDCGRA